MLSQELEHDNFNPGSAQKVVIEHALRLLDWELSRQAEEQPELLGHLEYWLETKKEDEG